MESFTPYLLTAETIDRDPLLTLESSDQLLIFGTIAPIDTVLGQVRLALADDLPAPHELLWAPLLPALVFFALLLSILVSSPVLTLNTVPRKHQHTLSHQLAVAPTQNLAAAHSSNR